MNLPSTPSRRRCWSAVIGLITLGAACSCSPTNAPGAHAPDELQEPAKAPLAPEPLPDAASVASQPIACSPWSLETPGASGRVLAMAEVDGEKSLVAVGEHGQLFTSNDAGASFRQRVSGTFESVTSVSAHQGVIHAVGGHGTLLRSNDGGERWQHHKLAGAPELRAIGRACGQRLLAISDTHLYLSDDGGDRWHGRRLIDDVVRGQLEHLVTGDDGLVLVATSSAVGVDAWLSHDCGNRFQPVTIAPGPETVGTITRDRQGVLYAFGGGRTVEASLHACGSCTDRVSTDFVLYRSADGGRTWRRQLLHHQPAFDGMGGELGPPVHMGYLGHLSSVVSGEVVYALDHSTLWVSRDQGASWTSQLVDDRSQGRLFAMADQLWLARESGYGRSRAAVTVLRSADQGQTFEPVTLRAATTPLISQLIGLHRLHDGALLAAGNDGDLARKAAGTSTWKRSNIAKSAEVYRFASDGDLVIAVGLRGAIHRSTDGGVTFSPMTSGTTENLGALWRDGRGVFWTGGEGVLLSSSDQGQTWSRNRLSTKSRLFDMWGAGETLYLVGVLPDIVYRSTDGGASWVDITARIGEGVVGIWGTSAAEVYAFGHKGLIRRSIDGGRSWQTMPLGGPGSPTYWTETVRWLRRHGDDYLVLLGSWLAQSTDGGTTWRHFRLTYHPFRASRVTEVHDHELVVAAFDGDMMRLDLGCKPTVYAR